MVADQLLDVRHTLGGLSADLGLMPREHQLAGVRTLNRTIFTARREAAAKLRQLFPGVKVSQLKGRMKLARATRGNMAASLAFSGRRFSLYGNFGMRGIRVGNNNFGVRFGRLPWRIETVSGEPVPAAMLARAFRNRARGSGAAVMARHTKVRTSHEVLVAPGIARAVDELGVGGMVITVMRNRFPIVFAQEARYRLSKR